MSEKSIYLSDIKPQHQSKYVIDFIKNGIVPFTSTMCKAILDEVTKETSSKILMGLKPRILKFKTEIKKEAVIAGLGL